MTPTKIYYQMLADSDFIMSSGRDSSISLSSASHAGNLGLNPGRGSLTWVTSLRQEEITNSESHIAPVSLTGM